MRFFADLPVVEVTSGTFQSDPVKALQDARAIGPMVRSERGIELLSHRLCQSALRDKRMLANHLRLVDRVGIPEGPVLEFKKRMLLGQGLTESRTRIRKTMVNFFGPGRVEDMRRNVRAIVDGLLDELATGTPADIWNGLCTQLPARLYCTWVGAPFADAPFVSRMSDQVLQIFDQDPANTPSIVAGYEELFPYAREHIATARANPDDTLMTQLIAQTDAGEMSEIELSDFVVTLLEASTDNTASQLAFAIANVVGSERDWNQVKAEPSIIPAAVRESIRFKSRSITNQRFPTDDIEIEGVLVPADTPINIVAWAAHLDPAAFEDPTVFNINRGDAARPVTFGGGMFSCLGQHIAEIEMQEAISALATRFPNAAIVDFKHEFNGFAATATALEMSLVG